MKLKRTVGDLAAFGGAPAFESPLHVGRPNIGDRGAFLSRVHDILDRRLIARAQAALGGPEVIAAYEGLEIDLVPGR